MCLPSNRKYLNSPLTFLNTVVRRTVFVRFYYTRMTLGESSMEPISQLTTLIQRFF